MTILPPAGINFNKRKTPTASPTPISYFHHLFSTSSSRAHCLREFRHRFLRRSSLLRRSSVSELDFDFMQVYRRKASMGTENRRWYSNLSYNKWIALSPFGLCPEERYKHAATISDDKLYIIGGSCRDRYLSDFQVLDLKTLKWSNIKLKMEATDKDGSQLEVFPGTSGPSMIKWKNRLLLLGGFTRSTTYKVTVWYIDLESYNCGVVETFGNIPVCRRGQSVTLFASKLVMFGGEDLDARPLNDVHILDLETMTWSAVETTQKPPAPRFDHVAALHAEHFLYIFGGCSHSAFFTDLHVLDLECMIWFQPPLSFDLVNARAGHAGVYIDGNLYVVGGKSGALTTLAINLSTLDVSVLTTVKIEDPLASEGLSISSITLGGDNFLITFGGYNGKYFNEVYAMRLKPRDSSHPKILQSPTSAAPETSPRALSKSETLKITGKIDLGSERNQLGTSQQDLANGINSINNNALEPPLVAGTRNMPAINIRQIDGSTYRQMDMEIMKEEQQFARPIQVRDFLSYMNEELTPVPENQLALLPSPIDHEHVGTSAEGAKTRTQWLRVENEVLAHAFMAITAEQTCNDKKAPSFWVRAAKFYNENKPSYVSSRTSNVMRSHWHTLKNKIYAFNAIHSSLHSACERSHSAEEIVMLAHVKHKDEYGYVFNHEYLWRIVKDHPVFTPGAIDVPACLRKARTSESAVSNSASNQEANAARVSAPKRNEEGMTKSNTEHLPVQKKARASNSSPNQDANAGNDQITGQTSTRANNASSYHEANAGIDLNEGDAQIIGQEGNETDENAEQMIENCNDIAAKLSEYTNKKLELKKEKVEAMKSIAEAKSREVWLKEYAILSKDTSEMTEQQRVIHAKACEMIKRRWNSENI